MKHYLEHRLKEFCLLTDSDDLKARIAADMLHMVNLLNVGNLI